MGEIVNRTYRRSAETTGVTVRMTPLGKGAGVGTKATDPGPTIGVNAATYHCNWALTIVAEAPLKVVTLGAWRTLARVSPWAAVRKKYISTSLRKAIPNVPPEPGIALVGAIRPPWVLLNGIIRLLEKFCKPPPAVPTTSGVWLG